MSKFTIGDLVVLKSGSMRMCVEAASEESISVVWCHEGVVGRDAFSPEILNRWEVRDETPRPTPRSFDAEPPKPYQRPEGDSPRPHRSEGEAPKPYQRPEGDGPKPYRPSARPMMDEGGKPYRPAGDGPKPYRPAGDKPYRGDGPKPYRPAGDKPFQAGGGKPYRDGPPKPYRPAGATDGPPRKTGWDGKPRDKKFFRKDE